MVSTTPESLNIDVAFVLIDLLSFPYYFKLLDSVEDYARKWTKREKEEVDTPSEWVRSR
jgi:hypothetical protein